MTPHSENIPHGYCHCNCGQKTKLARKTANDRGHVKGQPLRFIQGHNVEQPRVDLSNAAPFKIDGVYCRLLALTQGQFAIVDAVDYDWLASLPYYAAWARTSYYAVRTDLETGKTIRMHADIAGPLHDHENCVTLDNRRKNLRPASAGDNVKNRRKPKHNTSGYKGVMRDRYNPTQWIVQIQSDGKVHHVGTFKGYQIIAAAKAYDAAARRLHGPFANTNFPLECQTLEAEPPQK